MPRNKKQAIIYGICICSVMVVFLSLFNVTISKGFLNSETIKIWITILPITFLIAYLIQNLFVSKIKDFLEKKLIKKGDSIFAHLLFDAFCIVTIMSFIMTIIGELIGGADILTVCGEFLQRWPTNFLFAMLVNIFIAVPLAKFLMKIMQSKDSKTP